MTTPTYRETIDLIEATRHPDAIVSFDELTIGDWADELEREIRATRVMEGAMPITRFNAGTQLVYNLVPYAVAGSSDSDDEFVDTSTTLIALLTDFFGIEEDHTVTQLLDALEAEAELEDES